MNNVVTIKMLLVVTGLLTSLYGSLLFIVYTKADQAITPDKVTIMIIKEIKEGDFSTKEDISELKDELKAEIIVIRTDLKVVLGDIYKLLQTQGGSK